MAKRRMFSMDVIDTDKFLEMPMSSQLLYFHLAMRADDDGFISSPKRILRLIGASEDDLRVLMSKQYVIPFDSGVCVIRHWRMHNLIRNDRYTETVYKDEKNHLYMDSNNSYTLDNNGEEIKQIPKKETPEWAKNRRAVMQESELPYSFMYKIREAFNGKQCPICGIEMSYQRIHKDYMPTIQHNLPISKGGKHELGNISVVCRSCNLSIKDTETEALNADEVIKIWDEINRQPIGNQSAPQVRLGKDSLVEDSGDKERLKEEIETFLTAYNNISSLPKAIKLTETRKKHIQARIKEHGLETCIQALDKIKASDFLSGKNNQGWKPNLDWIVNQSNMIKILEGAYDNKKGGGDKKRAATIYDDDYYEGSI